MDFQQQFLITTTSEGSAKTEVTLELATTVPLSLLSGQHREQGSLCESPLESQGLKKKQVVVALYRPEDNSAPTFTQVAFF